MGRLFKKTLKLTGASSYLGRILQEDAVNHLLAGLDSDKDIQAIDQVMTRCRRRLEASKSWRQGPHHVNRISKKAFDWVNPYKSINQHVYCDLGCGRYHPYGLAVVMYINGASKSLATDLRATVDEPRAAEAIYDLLIRCFAHTIEWHWSDTSHEQFHSRLRMFDLEALRAGHLVDGLAAVPIQHVCGEISEI